MSTRRIRSRLEYVAQSRSESRLMIRRQRNARRRALLLEPLEPRQLLTYAAAVLADNPTGFWQMDEIGGGTLIDSAPGGGVQNGTYYGNPTFAQPAAHATGTASVRFDPTDTVNDYATVTNFPITQSFTIEWWAKSAAPTWNESGWFATERAANGFIMHPNEGATTWSAHVLDGSGGYHHIGTHDPGAAITGWHHYALTYNAATDLGVMHFDGKPVVTNRAYATSRAATATVTVEIGRDDAADRFGNGWLDDMAIYPAALTTEQISNHFAAAQGFANTLYSMAVLADEPVALWRMDEPAGSTTLIDSAPLAGAQLGTYYGDPTFGESGAVPGASTSVRFDPATGASDYATAPNVPMAKSFSIEFWVKSATATWNSSGWFAAGRANNGFILHPNGGATSWSAYVIDGGGGYRPIGTHDPGAAITDWHHYAMAYDATTDVGRMYFDGVPVVTNNALNATNRAANSTVTVEIGRDDMAGRFGNGWLDEMALYNKALTPQQVAYHVAAASATPVIWDGDAGDWQWSNPVNWLGDANIPDATNEVAVFQNVNSGAVDLGGATYTIAAVAFDNSTGSYTLQNGTLALGGIVQSDVASNTISAGLIASNAAISVVQPNGTLNLTGPITIAAGDLNFGGSGKANITGTINSSPYATVVLSDSPINYWRLNDASGTTAIDATGHNNGAYSASGLTYGLAGPLVADASSRAVDFAGGTMQAALYAGGVQSRFSVEFWINPDTLTNYNQGVGQGWNYWSFHTTATGAVYTGNNCCGTSNRFEPSLIPANTLQVGQWHHFVYTFDNTLITDNARFYKNGSLVATTMLTTGANLFSQMNLFNTVDGRMSEVAVYSTALGADRIQAHYDAAAGGNDVVKLGAGTLTLSGNNAHVGETRVLEGTLIAAASHALGTTTSGTTVAAGATLALQGGITLPAGESLTLGNLAFGTAAALRNISGINHVAGPIRLGGTSAVLQSDAGQLILDGDVDMVGSQLTVAGSGDTVVNGDLAGTLPVGRFIRVRNNGLNQLHIGEIEAFGAGVTPDNSAGLSANDLTGTTYESHYGSVQHGATSALVDNVINTGAETFTLLAGAGNEMVIDLNAITQVDRIRVWQRGDCCADRLQNFTVSLLADNGSGMPGATVWQANYPGQVPSYSRADFDFTRATAQTLTKTGTGTLTLNGNNSYLGQTRIDQGTLIAGHNNALGDAGGLGTTVAGGTTLALTGGITLPAAESFTFGDVLAAAPAKLQNLGGDNHVAGSSRLAGTGATFQSDAGNLSVDGDVDMSQAPLAVDGAAGTVITGDLLGVLPLGRFIRVRNNAATALHIGEIEAFGAGVTPDNSTGLSTNEIAGATFESYVGSIAHGAGDALVNNAIDGGAATFTLNNSASNEMVIDLNATTRVDRIRVWQRSDCCWERLQNITVSLLADDGSGLPGAVVWNGVYPAQVPNASKADMWLVPALTKTGTGTLTLSGNNSYAGRTLLNQGTLVAASNTALGDAAEGTTVAAGATLGLQNNITLPAGEVISAGDLSAATAATIQNVSGDNHVAGTVQAFGKTTLLATADNLFLDGAVRVSQAELTIDGPASTTINGNISPLAAAAARFVRVAANSTGASRELHIGEIEAFQAGVTPDQTATLSTNEITGESFEAETGSGGHGASSAPYNDVLDSGANTWDRIGTSPTPSYTLDLGATYELGELRVWQRLDCCYDRLSNFTVSLLADNGLGLPGHAVRLLPYPGQAPASLFAQFSLPSPDTSTLTKTGTGTLTLAGNNSFQGQTSVDQGTLVAGSNTALGAASAGTSVAAGATLGLQDISGPVTISGEAITLDGTGAAGHLGALVNLRGNNTIAADSSVVAAGDSLGEIRVASVDDPGTAFVDTLAIDADVDLRMSKLSVDGDGNTVIHGAIGGFGTAAYPSHADLILGSDVFGLSSLDPLAFWQFNEGSGASAADSSGNVNTGSLTGAAGFGAGRTATAGDFSLDVTSGGSVNVASAAAGAFNSVGTDNAVTLSLWVFGDPAQQPRANVTFQAMNGTNRVAFTHLPWSDRRVYWDSGYGPCCGGNMRLSYLTTNDNQFEGQWNNWVFVKNGGTDFSGIYLNGTLLTSTTGSTMDLGPINNMVIASDYRGRIDDLAFFSSALSGSTISDLYSAALGTFALPSDNSLIKLGAGTLTLTAANTYIGDTTVQAGTLLVNNVSGSGTGWGDVEVSSPGTLGGTGTIAGNVSGDGAVAPGLSPGILTINGDFAPTGTVQIEVHSPYDAAGTDFDQVVVSGSVDVTDATLALLGGATPPTAGKVVKIISKTSAGATTGPSSGLTDGQTVTIGSSTFHIFHNGGDGNDVVLVSANGTPGTLYVNDQWTSPAMVDGDAELAGYQTAYVGIDAFASIAGALAAYPAYSGPIVVNGGTYASAPLDGGGAVTLRLVQDLAAGETDVTIQDLSGAANDAIVTRYHNAADANVTIGQGAFAGVISGTGGLTKVTGGNTLTLSGPNTYQGPTSVQAGVLRVSHDTALGSTDAGTTVANNARLELAGGITVSGESLTISGSGGNNIGALQSQSGANTWAGDILLAADGTRVGANGAGQTLTVSGVIDDGPSTFTFAVRNADGGGATVLSGANTYGGNTDVVVGLVKLDGGDDRLPTGSVLRIGNTSNVASAAFDLNGLNQTVSGLVSLGTSMVMTVTNSSTTASTLTVNNAAASTYAGVVSGNLALTKSAAGTLALSGTNANSHTGLTTVSGGVLALNKTAAVDAVGGNLAVSGGTLQWSQNHQVPDTNTITQSGGTVNFNGKAERIATFTKSSGDTNTGGAGQTITISGTTTVSGGAVFNINSPSTWATNALTHTGGALTVGGGGGVLDIGAGGLSMAGTTINLNAGTSGATLRLGGNVTANASGTTANIAFAGGTPNNARVDLLGGTRAFTVANGGADPDLAVSATIANGGLIKSGSGRMMFNGANTYDGTTAVSAGQLNVRHAQALGSTAGETTVADGAQLELQGGITVSGETVTINCTLGEMFQSRN